MKKTFNEKIVINNMIRDLFKLSFKKNSITLWFIYKTPWINYTKESDLVLLKREVINERLI